MLSELSSVAVDDIWEHAEHCHQKAFGHGADQHAACKISVRLCAVVYLLAGTIQEAHQRIEVDISLTPHFLTG